MNKLFTKIAKLTLGLAMAAGVGVAIGAGRKYGGPVLGADQTTKTMTSFSSISGTVDGDSNIEYEAQKGNAGTAPVVNSNVIRIYQNGGLLVITPKNDSTINSITIGSSMATTVQVKVGSGSYSSNNAISAGGTYTASSLNTTSAVTFKCTGSSSSSRLYLNRLSVTYTPGSGGGSGGGDLPEGGTTYTFSSSSWAASPANWTNGSSGNGYTAGQGVQVTTGKSGANATSPKSFTAIEKIICVFNTNQSQGSGAIKVKVGSNTEKSNSVSYGGSGDGRSQNYETTFDFTTVETGSVKLTVTCTQNSIWLKSITIYEATTYTVTFNTNGHGTAPSSQSIVSGEKASEPTAPTASGYSFGGWYKEQSCTNPWNFSSDTVDDDTTLWAKWTVKSSALTFNLNGGSGTAPTGKTATYGSAMPTYGESAPTKTGYTFGGFYDGSGGTGTQYYTAGLASARTWDKDVTTGTILYAKWIAKTSALTFNLNTGSGTAPTGKTATYGSAMPAYGQSAPTKTGYTFAGFYDGEGGTGTQYYTAGLASARTWDKDTTDGTTLYAKWTINSYTVKGTISNGELSSEDNVNYNEALSITIVPDTDNDYTFPSSIESVTMGGNLYNGYEYDSTDGSFSIEHVTGDVEIVAHCVDTSATEYDVDYELDNCSITNAPETIYSNEIKELQIVADEHFKLPNSISISGIDSSKWSYDNTEGTILISEPDGDMTITVECVAKETYDITLSLTNVTKLSGPSGEGAVEEGEDVTIVFAASANYGLPSSISVEMGGDELTAGDDYTWTQNTGTLYLLELTDDLSVTISGVARDLTDGSLSLGSKKTAYTLGDDYELPATVMANFNIAPLTVDVKNEVEVSGPVTKNNNKYVVTGSGTVILTYTFSTTGKTQSDSYAITANSITPSSDRYVKVTSAPTDWSGTYLIVDETSSNVMDGTLTSNNGAYKSVTISNNEIAATSTINTYTFTIAKGTTDNTKYTVQSHSGYYIDRPTSGSGGGLTVSNSNAYELSIVYSTDHSEIRASCYASSGSNKQQKLQWNNSSSIFKFYNSTQRDIQLYKFTEGTSKELKWITATVNSGTYYQGSSVNSSNFTVTAHYNGGSPQSEVVTENITITNGYLANIGDNLVTLTYGGKSYNVNVVAVEQTATLTGLTWAQGELTIIDGHAIDFSTLGTVTAIYDVGPSSSKAVSSCTVSTYTKSNETYTKVSDISDGDTITSSSHGKYLGVTYTEKAVTKVAYSSEPIFVVESINDVYGKEETTVWSKTTSINAGDVVTFVNETESKVATSASSNIINATVFEDSISSALSFTVGKVGNYYTFQNEDGYLGNHSTGSSGSNNAYLDEEIDTSENKNYFTVEFDDGNVVITSVYETARSLQLRKDSTKDRFCFYGSTQLSIQLYKAEKQWVPSGDSIANTNAVAQKVVLEYATHFNDVMECVSEGTTSNVSGKWNDLAEDFDNWFNNGDKDLTELEVEHAKALFAGADAVEDGDTLQDMLARYEYICAKYKLDDFLSDAGRLPVAKSSLINPLINFIGTNTNTVAIIVIISMVSVTAIGGYFFLKKRKEN